MHRSYQDAVNEMRTEEAELERQANLSDEAWSKEQIEKDLTKYRLTHGISEEEIEKCREYLFSIPNIEDVVTRVVTEGLQWKYDRRKKWMTVVV